MTDPERMKIVESVDKLLKEEGRLIRLEKSLGVYVVKQFSLSDVFQRNVARKGGVQMHAEYIRGHDSQMPPQLVDVIELHKIRMIEQLHDPHFPFQRFSFFRHRRVLVRVAEIGARYDFDRCVYSGPS